MNSPYEGVIVASMPLVGSVPGKFYATELRERKDREWKGKDFTWVKRGLEYRFYRGHHLPIPHIVVAMPHVSRVYTFGNPYENSERETNVYEQLFDSETLTRHCSREIGCHAELAILGEELRFWRDSVTVEDYLGLFLPPGSLGKVADADKLLKSLEQQKKSIK